LRSHTWRTRRKAACQRITAITVRKRRLNDSI
jgi:hypothetical protein